MDDKNEFIKTTIRLTRKEHESAKMMAILTRTNMSHLIRVALAEKTKRLKEEFTKDS